MFKLKLALITQKIAELIKGWYTELILFIGILFAFIFRGFVGGSDGASSWFSPWYNLKENFFVWNTYAVPGASSTNSFTSFFLRLFYSLVGIFTDSPASIQKFTWIVLFQILSFVIYFLARKIFTLKKIDALFLTLFVSFNPVAQYFLWEKQHWAYYLAPIYFLTFIFYKHYLDTLNRKYLYIVSIIWFVCGFVFNQPAYFATWAIFIALTFIVSFLLSKEKTQLIKDHVRFSVFFLLANCVYFVPLVIGGGGQLQSVQDRYASGDPIPILRDLSTVNFFYSIINLTKGYGRFFSLNYLVIAIWTLYFIAIIYVVFFRKKDFTKRDYLYLLISTVFFILLIFLNKGISIPFPEASEKLFRLKLMYIFRDFKDKFALGYSLIFSVFAIYFLKSKSMVLKWFFVSISIISYGSFVFNAWLPNNFAFSNDLSYLKKAKLDTRQASRVLSLPLVDYSFFYTNNPSYSGDNPMKNIFKKEVLYTNGQVNQDSIVLKQMLLNGQVDGDFFENYLKRYNVQYILNNKNSYVAEDRQPYGYDFNILNKFDFIDLVQNEEEFQVFEYKKFLPKVFGEGGVFQAGKPSRIQNRSSWVERPRNNLVSGYS